MGKSKMMADSLQKYCDKLKTIKLDLGCGPSKKEGYIGIDMYDADGVDFVIDLDKNNIPLRDNSADIIYSSHFFEHISNPAGMFIECSRVLKRNGELVIVVPHYTNPYAYHFTHKTYWSSFSLEQHYIDYYLGGNLTLVSKKVNIRYFKPLDQILTWIANLNLNIYERILAKLINAWEIEFHLKKKPEKTKHAINYQLH